MTDKPNPSHWDLLAKELGAESAPPAASQQPAPPKPAPAAAPRRAAEPHRAAPRPAADWSQLVTELGATPAVVPPRKETRPAPTSTPPPVEARREPARREPAPIKPAPLEPEWMPQSLDELFRPSDPAQQPYIEPPRGFRDEFVIEETIEEFDVSIERDSDSPDARGEGESGRGDEEPRKGRRRRRRRRGRGGSGQRSAERPTSHEPESEDDVDRPAAEDDSWTVDDEPIVRDRNDRDEESGEPAGAGERDRSPDQPSEGGEDKGRPRRRRRRRGGRRKSEGRGESRSDESRGRGEEGRSRGEESRSPAARGPESRHEGVHDEDDESDDDMDLSSVGALGGNHGDADEDEDDHDFKASHRGIPTWDEAIGMIVAGNMEARARNPSGSQDRRGRRGHGRGRSHGR